MALDWLKNRFNEVSANLKTEVTKVRNKTFLEGVIAGCVLVAYADGVVKPEEKQKMIGFLQSSDVLSVFDIKDVISTFEKFAKRVRRFFAERQPTAFIERNSHFSTLLKLSDVVKLRSYEVQHRSKKVSKQRLNLLKRD